MNGVVRSGVGSGWDCRPGDLGGKECAASIAGFSSPGVWVWWASGSIGAVPAILFEFG